MTLLVGSAALDQSLLIYYLKEATRVIAVDGGLNHLETVGSKADIILGDFDSYHGKLPLDAKIFPKEKNFSDMEAALALIEKEEAVILGATGGRLDHFLSVLSLIRKRENIQLIDGQNRIFYRQGEFTLKKEEGYFSLFPQQPTLISIEGAKYNLNGAPVSSDNGLLLSNQWAGDVNIRVESGWVLVVLSRDK
ncbi:MAG: thiamine diphosphokinase [Tissierellia bacterium]|nr:thiamine diphosphokinase [Tissierellia bacterium]